MRIVQVQLVGVSVPFTRPEIWAMGVRPGVTNIIVRMTTDDGAEGLGEYPAAPAPDAALAIGRYLGSQFIGHDPGNVEPLIATLKKLNGWQHFPHLGNMVLAGFEMALWDLVGKATNLPAYRLFGGAYRMSLPIMYFLPNADLDSMVAEARTAVGQGFGTIYIKVGIDDRRDIDVVRAVRAASGNEVKLRIDANEAWSAKQAIRIGHALADCNLEFIEQPTPFHDVRSLLEVKQALAIPIAANQSS